MIIPDYEFNPYPHEIGDLLFDKECKDLSVLVDANSEYVYLHIVTGVLAGNVYTAHTVNSEDDYEKVGTLMEKGIERMKEATK